MSEREFWVEVYRGVGHSMKGFGTISAAIASTVNAHGARTRTFGCGGMGHRTAMDYAARGDPSGIPPSIMRSRG